MSPAVLERPEGEELWAAIGEPSRRRLLDVLLVRGEATPSALAADLPFTRQAVSKHLGVLDRAGLVAGHRTGREMRWSVRPERLDAATKEMRKVADTWDRRLRAIKEIAEQAHREALRAEAAAATHNSTDEEEEGR